MKRSRMATIAVCWAVVVLAAAVAIGDGHKQEREALVERFGSRVTTEAAFVSAYVDDIFAREERMAAALPLRGISPSDIEHETQTAGFTASVLLDRRGRVLASSPPDRELLGVDLGDRYPHLASALSGTRMVSGVVLSAVERLPIVAFALPIDGGNRSVLSAGFSLQDTPLTKFLTLSPFAGVRGYITDATGTPAVLAGEGATPSLDGISVTGTLNQTEVVGGRVVVSAPISGTQWRLTLTAQESSVVAAAVDGNWVDWLIYGVVTLLTFIGLLALRSVSNSRARSREAQAVSDERFRLTVDNAPIGMMLVDLDGRIISANERLCGMLGFDADELTQRTFGDITHPDDLDRDLAMLSKLMAGELSHYEMENRYLRQDGATIWGRLSVSLVRDSAGKPLHSVRQVEDVTALHAAQDKLEQRALYDSLTGLANRGLLMDRLAHSLADHRRDVGLLAVAFCDLDHFKRVNDSLGHHAGDLVLQEVARRLSGVVRDSDTVARVGGDEFVLILPRVSSLAMATAVLDEPRWRWSGPSSSTVTT